MEPGPPGTKSSTLPGADPGGGGGGGVLGVRTPPPPFGGPPDFIKREKTLRVHANMPHFST